MRKKREAVWYCENCNEGPMNTDVHQACIFCSRPRTTYSTVEFLGSEEEISQPSSAPFAAAHLITATAGSGRSAGKADIGRAQPTSEGASQKSGSPIDIRHDSTHEESSISLWKVAEHAQGPSEHEVTSGKPVEETKNHREPDKGAITGDAISISDDIYEQWIADDILSEDSGDTVLNDDVEQKHVQGPSSDFGSDLDSLCSENDLDSLGGPLIEVETNDCSSDDSDTSEGSRAMISRGFLLPPLIYMLLVRVCGIIARLFEPNPLSGRKRIRWTCVSQF